MSSPSLSTVGTKKNNDIDCRNVEGNPSDEGFSKGSFGKNVRIVSTKSCFLSENFDLNST